ncbi:hypothetical protein [Terrabacter carboxydivorans]|uniref:DUF1345 domain-containing protein n=1 Tax=Terrabacter carboxydivorans TaxID=619730 RepID=A0ABP5Y986_9MICO
MAGSRPRRSRHETRSGAGENRLWPALAVVVAALAYAVLPDSLLVGPRLAIPAVELVLLGALLVTNPRRLVRQTRWSRGTSITLACLVIATNLVALAMLVRALTSGKPDGMPLLLAGMQVWLTNVIGFGLLFWEIDRGGPVARHTVARDRMPTADWRFSQDENQDAVLEVSATSSVRSNWRPEFIDYLYVSLTNSSAFSPTDTMPLTGRAKALMGLEATAALLTSLLVVARAIGALGQ